MTLAIMVKDHLLIVVNMAAVLFSFFFFNKSILFSALRTFGGFCWCIVLGVGGLTFQNMDTLIYASENENSLAAVGPQLSGCLWYVFSGVVARKKSYLPYIRRALSVEAVSEYFSHFLEEGADVRR